MFQRTTAINKILALKKRIKVVQGGTSASKTFGIIAILIDRATKTPNIEISIVSETVPHLRRGALKDFLKIMKLTGRYIDEHFNKTLLKYTFANGAYIEFFSVEQEASVRGQRRNVLYINECNNISFETYHQLSIRTDGDIYLDYNPSKEFWVQTELLKDENVDFIILTYKDNEALQQSIIDEIEKGREKAKTSKYWDNWWKVYGLGLMGTLDGVVFGEFKNILKFPPREKLKWVAFGMDFGYGDPTTLIRVGFDGIELYLEQLLYQTGLTNSDINKRLKEIDQAKGPDGKQLSPIGRSEIIADSARPENIEELRRMGWNIIASEKGPNSINYGIDLIKRYPTNIVNASLELIKEWREGYQYKFDKSTNKYLNEPVDEFNHCCDPIRYVCKRKMTAAVAGRARLITS